MPRGEQLGRYRVLELIGQGGMGTVHLGEHELLRHHVAIKILHDRHTRDPAMERRFYNEARAIAALEHPGIVKLFDIGRADDGRAYLVMELLRGQTLRQRIGVRGVAQPHLLHFALQIASALGAAHERGIVHRDVKPENVFIVSDPDVATGERVKILDFGVAKRTQLSGTPSPEITRAGVLLGTPAYMAPEQCRGDDEIDARADIYAFGILLYEMVAGTLPFNSTNTEEVLSKQIYCAPPPLAAGPGLPAGIVDVVARCLAKAPGDRFPTMAQVGAALQALVTTAEPEPEVADDEEDGEFPDLETLPLLGRMEDATTGVVIAVPPAAPPRVSRRRVLLAIASAAAIAVALSMARGGSGSSAAPTENGRANTALEPTGAEPAVPEAAPRTTPASRKADRMNRPPPRPSSRTAARQPTEADRAPDRSGGRDDRPTRAEKVARQDSKPARVQRRERPATSPSPARPPPPKTTPTTPPTRTTTTTSTSTTNQGDPFAEIEPPTVF